MRYFRFFFFILVPCCSSTNQNAILHQKSAIFIDEKREVYILDCRDGSTRRIASIAGVEVGSVRSLVSYDPYGILQLTVGDSVHMIILEGNQRYSFSFDDERAFQVLDQRNILITHRTDSLPQLLHFDGLSVASTTVPSRELNKSIYDHSALCMRNKRIYFNNAGIRVFETDRDTVYTLILHEKEAKVGNFLLVGDYIVINTAKDGRHLMSIYDVDSLKLIRNLVLDGSFQLNRQYYATQDQEKEKILIRRTDRAFAAGFGDYCILDLSDYTIKPMPSFDKFRFGFFAGFIDNRYIEIFEMQN